jgi:hypothetical protein
MERETNLPLQTCPIRKSGSGSRLVDPFRVVKDIYVGIPCPQVESCSYLRCASSARWLVGTYCCFPRSRAPTQESILVPEAMAVLEVSEGRLKVDPEFIPGSGSHSPQSSSSPGGTTEKPFAPNKKIQASLREALDCVSPCSPE